VAGVPPQQLLRGLRLGLRLAGDLPGCVGLPGEVDGAGGGGEEGVAGVGGEGENTRNKGKVR
jgi:hypothetical protein